MTKFDFSLNYIRYIRIAESTIQLVKIKTEVYYGTPTFLYSKLETLNRK